MLNRPINVYVLNRPRNIVFDNATDSGPQYFDSIDKRLFILSSPEQAENIAQKVIDHLLSSGEVGKTLTELDQVISPQIKKKPEKKNWLSEAFKKFKDSFDKLPDEVFIALQGATGSILAQVTMDVLTKRI